jgi:ABC-type multidrug transport system fused ATPase/permease subunit
MQALGASVRIFEILDSDGKIQLNKGFMPKNEEEDLETFDGSVKFQDVHFSYPTRLETQVLKNVSFEIERGKTVALVGPSGGGKSTIFALIERFYDPDSGFILIGQKELKLTEINLNWLHSRIALVSQEPVLFGGKKYI